MGEAGLNQPAAVAQASEKRQVMKRAVRGCSLPDYSF